MGMKKFALFAITALTAVALAGPGALAVTEKEPATLKPENEQRFATRLATRFLTSYHYQRQDLDEEFSSRVFDQYLRALDPNRVYFTAADIEYLERYRRHMGDALKTADLDPAYDIFNRYSRRLAERVAHARKLLDSEFDFTIEESYRFDRSEAPWPEDSEALDEIWRKRVKNDWLSLRLAEREPDEIRETLDKRYRNMERRVRDFNSQDVFQFFMNAFARSIEPHSAYMSPRLAENFEISMRLSLDGIGALLSPEDEYTTVQEVVPGGPADLDGRLRPGDRIVGVGQEDEEMVDVVGWRLDDVVDLIRGERDTQVRLEILPAEFGLKGPSKTIEIVRNEVKLEEQAAKAHVEEIELNGVTKKIGVIRVPVFYVDFKGRSRNEPNYRSSTRDVRRLINELKSDGVDGVVMDLRDNGGGALVEATTMTGLFIDEGPVVQVRDARGRVNVERDREPGMAWEGPLAVLVNRSSASASEIFAAAIQDYGRGIVLGEPTFGKGTVQNLLNLDDFSTEESARLGQVKLTMAQFFRIDGGSTQARGVIPDIGLPSAGSPEDYGESALDYALPWAEIDEAEFLPLADLSTLVPLAEKRHLDRRESLEDLQELIEDLKELERLRERKEVSLHEVTRAAERAEAEERRRMRLGIEHPSAGREEAIEDSDELSEPSDTDQPDVLLVESARILADLIDLDREQQLLVQGNQNLVPAVVIEE